MPTYEYKCNTCGYQFEEFQSIKAEPIRECPQCKGSVKRLIGVGNGFLFRGNGFYITDYRSDNYKKAQQQDADSASESRSSKSSSLSSKPEPSKSLA
ncbi:MAG: zinc ribbon domain-containing protein [candidate division KSB1 bacterium]|nr:zinc ribbon domain-containing protein [candidate division KSB1 bacterium]MDZ7317927.1 zinc ribbon domain-containing protein [candidate division KSB1 bacterium]MDZ7340698.1 zinc ribbon domain-containing protein [candidate division KSB1 bacterium]